VNDATCYNVSTILEGEHNIPETINEEEIYKLARKRVQDKKDFFTHLIVYVVINAMLVAI